MAEAQYAHNHVVDPVTGFIESKAYLNAFDAERKTCFIKLLVESGLSMYDVCDTLSLSMHTVNKHYQMDAAFRAAVDEARREYADRLDGVSKRNALNPKSVIERIFQLKSLFPEKYADQRNAGSTVVNLNFVSEVAQIAPQKEEAIDVQPITEPTPELRATPPAEQPVEVPHPDHV